MFAPSVVAEHEDWRFDSQVSCCCKTAYADTRSSQRQTSMTILRKHDIKILILNMFISHSRFTCIHFYKILVYIFNRKKHSYFLTTDPEGTNEILLREHVHYKTTCHSVLIGLRRKKQEEWVSRSWAQGGGGSDVLGPHHETVDLGVLVAGVGLARAVGGRDEGEVFLELPHLEDVAPSAGGLVAAGYQQAVWEADGAPVLAQAALARQLRRRQRLAEHPTPGALQLALKDCGGPVHVAGPEDPAVVHRRGEGVDFVVVHRLVPAVTAVTAIAVVRIRHVGHSLKAAALGGGGGVDFEAPRVGGVDSGEVLVAAAVQVLPELVQREGVELEPAQHPPAVQLPVAAVEARGERQVVELRRRDHGKADETQEGGHVPPSPRRRVRPAPSSPAPAGGRPRPAPPNPTGTGGPPGCPVSGWARPGRSPAPRKFQAMYWRQVSCRARSPISTEYW